MWPFSAKKSVQPGTTSTIQIDGMHCTSCALTIDDALEELTGVYEARASYAKGMVTVRYNPAQLQPKKLQEVIEELGYSVVVSA